MSAADGENLTQRRKGAEKTVKSYDEIADWYEAFVANEGPVHALTVPALMALAGDVQGVTVCDLACGQGIVARRFAEAGAMVTGVDISPRLLEIARGYEEQAPLGIVYRLDDAQSLPEIANGAFDGVACNLALIDIPELNACLQAVHRVLKPGGWFLFAIPHPNYETPDSRWTGQAGGTVKREVRRYFQEGFWVSTNPHGVRGQVGSHHRMLSTYLNALADAGFHLERTLEPQARDEVSSRVPGYCEVPVALVVRCRKQR